MQGKLHRLGWGIYAVGRPQLTPEGCLTAAVLACGPTAALSHSSAAHLWGIRTVRSGAIEVSTTSGTQRRRPGITVHRREGTHRSRHHTPPRHPGHHRPLAPSSTSHPASRQRRSRRPSNQADVLRLIEPGGASRSHRGPDPPRRRRASARCSTTAPSPSRAAPSSATSCRSPAPTSSGAAHERVRQRLRGRLLLARSRTRRRDRRPSLPPHAPSSRPGDGARPGPRRGGRTAPYTHGQIRFEPARVTETLIESGAPATPKG